MKIEKLETLITNHKELNQLLNEKEITGFSDFSKIEFITQEFKEYIEERYISIFKESYTSYSTPPKNEAKINALIRSVEFLATQKAVDNITEDLMVTVNKSLDLIKECKTAVDENVNSLNISLLNVAHNNTTINIINKLKTSQPINDAKTELIAHTLYICDVIGEEINPKYQKELYRAQMNTLDKLQKIEGYNPKQKKEYLTDNGAKGTLAPKKKNRGCVYWVLIGLGIAFFILKVLSRAL